MSNDIKKMTIEELYIPPFDRERVYDSQGVASYVPIERNLRPTGVEIIDRILQSLAAGTPYRQMCQQMDFKLSDLTGFFRILTGMTTSEFSKLYSLRMADDLLRYTDMEMDEVARRSGIGTAVNLFYFYRDVHKTSPGERRYALRGRGDLRKFKLAGEK